MAIVSGRRTEKTVASFKSQAADCKKDSLLRPVTCDLRPETWMLEGATLGSPSSETGWPLQCAKPRHMTGLR